MPFMKYIHVVSQNVYRESEINAAYILILV